MGNWSNITFDRWVTKYPHSLPYRIFKCYDNDLMGMITSFESAKGYVYKHLANDGAVWDSIAHDYGLMLNNDIRTIKEWSNNYNEFENWLRLSWLMSLCSCLETYLACIIKECIESDPGLLIAVPHAIDGIYYKKKGISVLRNEDLDLHIRNCTKGTWQSRFEHLARLFGSIPPIIYNSISDLEKIRKIRNDFGHAFGRDIQESQDYFKVNKSPIIRLSVKRFNKYHTLIVKIIQELDEFLCREHIGNYEPLLHYHSIYNTIVNLDKGARMIELKKTLHAEKNTGYSKDFCRGIILYYENL